MSLNYLVDLEFDWHHFFGLSIKLTMALNYSIFLFYDNYFRDETLEALSDAQVVAPATLTVDLHSADHRNSFLYVFDYQTKFGDYPPVRIDF